MILAPLHAWMLLGFALLATILLGRRMSALQNLPISPRPKQVTLELAWTPRRAAELRAAWGEPGIMAVRSQVFLDFPFIVAYVTAGLAASYLAAAGYDPKAPALSALVSRVYLLWLGVGVLDVMENLILLAVLHSPQRVGLQPLASVCATLKFLLILFGISYPLTAVLARLP